MKILIGTTNKGKFLEIQEIFHGLKNIELIRPETLGIIEKPNESGANYEENALIKARFYSEKSGGMITLAEDSGIEVSAFPGKLGHHTRRWGAGENASDEEWLSFFLKKLKEKSDKNAIFCCTAALITPKKTLVFEATCSGILLNSPQIDIPSDIPLSACFLPNGYSKVYAALRPEEKNKISHRGKAIKQARTYIENMLQ